MDHDVTFLELIRTLWPIFAALFGGLMGAIVFSLKTRSMAESTQSSFEKFKEQEYPKDRLEVLEAIKEVRLSQERSEEKLEKKLDLMSSKNDSQLEKVYTALNATNTTLAEIKGRLYHNTGDGQTKL